MVFELLAQSVFDFLKENSFHPFPTWQIQSFSAQIVEAVAFLHNLRLIHTDLKPGECQVGVRCSICLRERERERERES
jgi:serine/threonine protein kinase